MQTFIVRLAPAEHPDEAWHGVVQRIADGHEQPFHNADQLLAVMRPMGDRTGWAADNLRETAE